MEINVVVNILMHRVSRPRSVFRFCSLLYFHKPVNRTTLFIDNYE